MLPAPICTDSKRRQPPQKPIERAPKRRVEPAGEPLDPVRLEVDPPRLDGPDGDPRPDDRLLIFEDADGDGRADKCKVFYDQLHCPTGFEFWNGGVLVVDQPRLIWLKDTDEDDRADEVVQLFDGWAGWC